jgi:HSP20 family molecular chaperone IbpA
MLEFHHLTTGALSHRLTHLDVHEESGELILRAEIPGLTLGPLDVRMEQGELVLDADGWDGSVAGSEHYEHLHGCLPLPFRTDGTRVSGEVEGEALELHIPIPET